MIQRDPRVENALARCTPKQVDVFRRHTGYATENAPQSLRQIAKQLGVTHVAVRGHYLEAYRRVLEELLVDLMEGDGIRIRVPR